MFNKKIYLILLLFIVSICTLSAASASENVTDTVAIDDAVSDDAVSISDEDSISEIDDNSKNQEILANPESDDATLSEAKSDDILSGAGVMPNQYSINLNDEYQIVGKNGGTIIYYLSPYQMTGMNGYNFYFDLYAVVDNAGNTQEIYKSNVFASDSDRAIGNRQFPFPAKTIAPGKYILYAVNSYMQNTVMDAAILNVEGNAIITASDYTSNYKSGAATTVKITDKDTGLPLKYVEGKIEISNGKTQYFFTDSKGQFSWVPSLSAGTYKATYSLSENFKHVSTASVTRNIVINKSPVSVKATKASAYIGSKVKLKASVTSEGKNVKEGKVTFKINGKTYAANVKNGVATKLVKLPKAKKYAYTATFKGANFQKAKAASSVVTIKPKIATKIIVKNQKAYRGSPKAFYVTVKTASGKIVKSGKVKIIDTVKVNKKGKAKFYATANWNYIKQVGNTVYFKKSVTKTLNVKYTPASAAYKPSKTKMKITLLYKCTYCGSKTSHSHNGMIYIVRK